MVGQELARGVEIAQIRGVARTACVAEWNRATSHKDGEADLGGSSWGWDVSWA